MTLQPAYPFLMSVFHIALGTPNRIAGVCKVKDCSR